MTSRQIFVISSLFVTFISLAQQKSSTFKMSDTIFQKGSYLRTYSVIYQVGSCDLHDRSYQFLDSLVDFLATRKNLSLQVNRHDFKPDPRSSIRAAKCRAQSTMEYLVTKGVSKDRLSTRGFDGTEPLISQQQIDKAKSKEEKTALMMENLRVEFVITSVDLEH